MESKRLQRVAEEADSEDGREASDRELQAKRYELAEGERIAQDMDTLMSTIPFIDHLELIRLRAHLALWTADLLERVDDLEAEVQSDRSMQEQEMEQAWLGNTEVGDLAVGRPPNPKAANARQLASTMLAKLRGSRESGASDANDGLVSGSDIET